MFCRWRIDQNNYWCHLMKLSSKVLNLRKGKVFKQFHWIANNNQAYFFIGVYIFSALLNISKGWMILLHLKSVLFDKLIDLGK